MRIITIVTISFILSTNVYASNSFSEGKQFYKHKKYAEAIDRFMQILADDPHNKEARKYIEKSACKLASIEKKKIKQESRQLIKTSSAHIKEARKLKKAKYKEMNRLFKLAKKDYSRRRYLKASDQLRKILLEYPEHDKAEQYYKRITQEMYETSKVETANLEELSYAKGYVCYREQQYYNALSEWRKVLEINPKRSELTEYVKDVEEYLANAEQLAKEREIEDRVKSIFKEGTVNFNSKEWVSCIKEMEKVQKICRNESFPQSLEWHSKAQKYIEKSVNKLSEIVVAEHPKPEPPKPIEKPVEQKIDVAGSEKQYKQGLIYYKHGRLFDAVNAWEIALRLNPNNEKAKKALENTRSKLNIHRK